MLKAQYDIVYKNIVRRSDSSMMDLNGFFEACEEIANRLFKKGSVYENMLEFVDKTFE